MRPRSAQQGRRVVGRGAELARQIEHGVALRQRQANDQAEIAGHTGRRASRRRILASSSCVSSTKSRTPCCAHASRIAPRALTGCMKWIAASANICRTSRTSAIEAQSKCVDAAGPHRAEDDRFGIALHGVHHIAGEGRRRKPGCRRGDGGRSQAVHRLLRPLDGDQIVDRGQHIRKRRQTGHAAARRPNGRAVGSSWKSSQAQPDARKARPAVKTNGKKCRAARQRCGRRTQPVLRVLRIAADRSANIGGSLTTTGPLATGSTEKDALRRCCAPEGARGTCDASTHRPRAMRDSTI